MPFETCNRDGMALDDIDCARGCGMNKLNILNSVLLAAFFLTQYLEIEFETTFYHSSS